MNAACLLTSTRPSNWIPTADCFRHQTYKNPESHPVLAVPETENAHLSNSEDLKPVALESACSHLSPLLWTAWISFWYTMRRKHLQGSVDQLCFFLCSLWIASSSLNRLLLLLPTYIVSITRSRGQILNFLLEWDCSMETLARAIVDWSVTCHLRF